MFDKTAGQPFWTAKRPEQSEGEGHGWPESIMVGVPKPNSGRWSLLGFGGPAY